MDKKEHNIDAYSRLISVGLLAAGVAHEIANPTAFVKSNTAYLLRNLRALIKDNNLPAKQAEVLAEAVDILQENADGLSRIERLLRELKSYSRGSGTIGPVSLKDVFESAIILSWNRLKYKAEIIKNFDGSVVVHADYSKVEEVVINLLNNASDALESRGKIVLQIYKKGDRGCFEVEDNGAGIPADSQEQVFEPFFTTKGSAGTGLGLYLCKKIINEAGGTIDMSSTPGQGTCFTICLPLSESDTD